MGGVVSRPARLYADGRFVQFSENQDNPRSYGGYVTGKIVAASRHADTYEWIYTVERSLTHATGDNAKDIDGTKYLAIDLEYKCYSNEHNVLLLYFFIYF